MAERKYLSTEDCSRLERVLLENLRRQLPQLRELLHRTKRLNMDSMV